MPAPPRDGEDHEGDPDDRHVRTEVPGEAGGDPGQHAVVDLPAQRGALRFWVHCGRVHGTSVLRDRAWHIGKIPRTPLIPGDKYQPRIRDWYQPRIRDWPGVKGWHW